MRLDVGSTRIDVVSPAVPPTGLSPCLVLFAGSGWVGGAAFGYLNYFIARRVSRLGYSCAVVLPPHRQVYETVTLEVGLFCFLLVGSIVVNTVIYYALLMLLGGLCFARCLGWRNRSLSVDHVAEARVAWRALAAAAEELGIDDRRLVLGGYSSGAQLAALLAFSLLQDDVEEAVPERVVLLSGLYDVGAGVDAALGAPFSFIVSTFLNDVLGTQTACERDDLSPAMVVNTRMTDAQLRKVPWGLSSCRQELGGLQPFQRALFSDALHAFTHRLQTAGATINLVTLENANHWTLALSIDEALNKLLFEEAAASSSEQPESTPELVVPPAKKS